MSDGSKVDMSLDDIIKMGGRGRGGRGRGVGRGARGGRGRGRGAGVGRAVKNQQSSTTRQQQGRGAFRGSRTRGRGFKRGGSALSGRGRGQNTGFGFSTGQKQQLGVKGGGVVKRRIGNLRGQGRGRGGIMKLKTAIQTQLQSQSQGRGRGRGRGGRGARTNMSSTDTSTSWVQFKNFQVSVSGLGSTQGDSDLPEGVHMDVSFSVKHTTGVTLNSRFTPRSNSNQSNDSRLVTANGRAVKRF